MLYATPRPIVRLVIIPVRTLKGIPMRYIVPRIQLTANATGNNVTTPSVALFPVNR